MPYENQKPIWPYSPMRLPDLPATSPNEDKSILAEWSEREAVSQFLKRALSHVTENNRFCDLYFPGPATDEVVEKAYAARRQAINILRDCANEVKLG